jgi:hypothetical protein
LKTPKTFTCHRNDGFLSQRERRQESEPFLIPSPFGRGSLEERGEGKMAKNGVFKQPLSMTRCDVQVKVL